MPRIHYPACMKNPNGKSAIEKRLKKAKKRIEKNEKDREKWWKGAAFSRRTWQNN